MIAFSRKARARLPWLPVLLLAVSLAACGTVQLPAPSATASPSLAPSATHSPAPSRTPSPAATTPVPPAGAQAVWQQFATPQFTPVTPIPPPLTGLVVPEEVRVLVAAGLDRPVPFSGRTDAIALVIYHPRLARASLVSVPPDLFGYIPGYTMQRMYTAYAVGGPRMLSDAIEYNLGLRPDSYAIFNLDNFSQLIDDLGGIQVVVLDNVTRYCPDILPGRVLLNGQQAICYMRLRLGEDEFSRNLRQQDVLRTVFLRMVEGGNLVRVPELYSTYRAAIETNLTLDDLLAAVPLALKLGDPNRVGYFHLTPAQLELWQLSDQPEASVFLPRRAALMRLMQQAIDFVSTPSPLSEVVLTLEYELTISPTPTNTATPTPTPTQTFTPQPSWTLSPTISLTPTITPLFSLTPTLTLTPTITPTLNTTLATE